MVLLKHHHYADVWILWMVVAMARTAVVEAVDTTTTMPVFLFAGQSNMLGHPNQAGDQYTNSNPGDPGHRWNTLLPILTDSSTTTAQKQTLLQTQINKVPSSVADATRASFMASQLLDMSSRYGGSTFWNEVNTPMDRVYCSFTNPANTNVLDTGAKLSPSAGCGNPWALELLFAHIMAKIHYGADTDFAVVKVAAGGTEIRKDWSSPSGNHWDVLQNRIQTSLDSSVHPACGGGTKTCGWAGFVWFQGENDCFAETNANNYYTDLQDFVRTVRTELHTITPLYATADEIPVIIVKLGFWASRLAYGSKVIDAQIRYASETDHTYTIETVDLGRFYHYDAASHIIIGDRLAQTVASIWNTGTTTAPIPSPTSHPAPITPPPFNKPGGGWGGWAGIIDAILKFLASLFGIF
jgi:hypothetical protein